VSDEGKKYLKIAAGAFIVLVVLTIAACLGWPAYRHFKERRNAAQAQDFFAKGDYRNALLCARVALLINSNNVPACRVMAELNDSVHSPAALDWRRRVAELSPAISNQLDLASAGLRYENPPFPLTTQILGELSSSAGKLPDFHVLSAELDLSLRRMTAAENEFEMASELEPTNQLFHLNLAVIRLGSTNAATADAARAKLKELSNDPRLGPAALRSLAADRLMHNDTTNALNFSTQLLTSAQAGLPDRLQHLGILQRLKNPELLPQLKSVQQSSTNVADVAQVASWMTANGFSADTILWLTNLPATLQTQPPVRLAAVNCFLAQTNWPALRDFTAKGDWGEIEYLRFAFLSHACNELGQSTIAQSNWHAAVAEAGEKPGSLNELLQIAGRWGMTQEQDELLWIIAAKFPHERRAAEELAVRYFAAGDTVKLNQLYSLLLASFPNDDSVKNNFTATSLLLKTNLPTAFKLAQDLFARLPDNPDVVSTYAYALHLQGRTREGAAAMEKLKGESLKKPSTALYYGVLLSALGENEKAAPLLATAAAGKQLLPEEKQLLAQARKAE
jgi:predicted Zn-dependent protease